MKKEIVPLSSHKHNREIHKYVCVIKNENYQLFQIITHI